MAEVQEPEDLSILLEWRDFEIDGKTEGHLGLGFEVALGAVEIRKRTDREINSLVSRENEFGSVLVEDAGEYFVLERLDIQSTEDCEAGFAIVILLHGKIILTSQHGKPMTLVKGETVVVPYGVGAIQFSGVGDILVIRPPLAT